jgi:diguanylate cyclase (GGDEF)-like protein/PAS domain S-box-containing protein
MNSKIENPYLKYFDIIITIIVIITFFTIYSLTLYKDKTEKIYYEYNLNSEKIAFNSSVEKFRLITTYIFDREINKPEILEILYKANNSEKEQDRRYYKGLLYKKLYPIYDYLKKEGVRQLHFQTNDNRSFLRFHQPSKFNDDLSIDRSSIKYVNDRKTIINIFETGKVMSGFRNIFPIVYNAENLGTVEISLTLRSMIDSLLKLDYEKEHLFILNKSLIKNKTFDQQKYIYSNSLISTNFLEESSNKMLVDSPSPSSELVNNINTKISKDKGIQESLLKKESISKIIKLNDKYYDVVFLPLIGINNSLEGYLVSYKKATNVPFIVLHFSWIIFILIFTISLLLFLLKIIRKSSIELIEEKSWLLQINDSLGEGLYVLDNQSKIKYINPVACKILGYKKEELLGKNAHYLFHYHSRNKFTEQKDCSILKKIQSDETYESDEEFFEKKNGNIIPIEINAKKLLHNDSYEIISIFRDLTHKKELESETALLKLALNFCSDSIVITDKEANVEWANPAFEKLTGFKISEIEGKKPKEFVSSGLQSKEFYEELWSTILSKKPWKGELINKRKDNTFYYEELSITPVLDFLGEIKHFIAVKQDITDRKNKDIEIEHFADYDFLTNLPNRRLFNNSFKKILNSLLDEDKFVGILFLDLDKFKLLNDTKGHDYGDILLKEVSSRLKQSIRNIDFVARLGGDEFVIILDHLPNDYNQAKVICERICEKIVNTIRDPFILKDYEYISSASIGAHIFNSFNNDFEQIIKKSDIALYKAKKNGGNSYFIYTDE